MTKLKSIEETKFKTKQEIKMFLIKFEKFWRRIVTKFRISDKNNQKMHMTGVKITADGHDDHGGKKSQI